MKIRKQYSKSYQVFELEEEFEDLDVAKVNMEIWDNLAKTELDKMVSIVGETNTAKSTQVQDKSVSLLSEKQATTIKNQYKRAVQIASSLGITINSYQDVDNLTSKQANAIISEFFKGAKSNTGF